MTKNRIKTQILNQTDLAERTIIRYQSGHVMAPITSLKISYALDATAQGGYPSFVWDGERLYHLRKLNNLKQTEAAKALGCTTTMLSRWEQGKYIPSHRHLNDLCVFFGVTPEYFFRVVFMEDFEKEG